MPSHLDSRQLAEHLKFIRIEMYGISGIAELARQLGIPAKTWGNYENGVTIPGEMLLKFIELSSVDPQWLATGEGCRFLGRSPRHDFASAKTLQRTSPYTFGPSAN